MVKTRIVIGQDKVCDSKVKRWFVTVETRFVKDKIRFVTVKQDWGKPYLLFDWFIFQCLSTI